MCKICTKSEYACQSSFRQDWQCLKEKLINIDRCPVIRSRKQRPEDALTKRSDHETSVSEMKGLREECWSREKKGKRHWKAKRECSRRDSCSFCHEDNQRGKTAQSSSLAPKSQTQNDGRRPLKGNASRSGPSCDYWHPPAFQRQTKESGRKFGDECLFRHVEADSQPSKKVEEKRWKESVASKIPSRRSPCRF